MEVLYRETQHRTIAELTRSAQVSRQTTRTLIRQLEAERKLDVSRGSWPHAYLLKPENRHDQAERERKAVSAAASSDSDAPHPEEPARDGAAVVREAVEALLLIGCWGLHDSNRPEVWTLAMRARRVLDGDPMTGLEAAGFRAKTEQALRGRRAAAERADQARDD